MSNQKKLTNQQLDWLSQVYKVQDKEAAEINGGFEGNGFDSNEGLPFISSEGTDAIAYYQAQTILTNDIKQELSGIKTAAFG